MTPLGRARGAECLARHQRLTQLIQMVCDLDEEQAEENACRMEHVVSRNVIVGIEQFLRSGDTHDRILKNTDLSTLYEPGNYEFCMGIYRPEKTVSPDTGGRIFPVCSGNPLKREGGWQLFQPEKAGQRASGTGLVQEAGQMASGRAGKRGISYSHGCADIYCESVTICYGRGSDSGFSFGGPGACGRKLPGTKCAYLVKRKTGERENALWNREVISKGTICLLFSRYAICRS